MADRTAENPTTLYRLYGSTGCLLYVGVAGNPGRRFEQHRSEKPWWGEVSETRLEHFPSRPLALAAELRAIHTEAPIYNVASNGRPGSAFMDSPLESHEVALNELGPYPPRTRWRFRSITSGFERVEPLFYHWELNCSSISDDYVPEETTAYYLWRLWLRYLDEGRGSWDPRLGCPWVDILWIIGDVAEFAPFSHEPYLDEIGPSESFLSFFSWPSHEVTGEPINWNRLPVRNLRWTPGQANKGGFIQEVTGWKPSPLQPYVNVESLAAAAQLARPRSRALQDA